MEAVHDRTPGRQTMLGVVGSSVKTGSRPVDTVFKIAQCEDTLSRLQNSKPNSRTLASPAVRPEETHAKEISACSFQFVKDTHFLHRAHQTSKYNHRNEKPDKHHRIRELLIRYGICRHPVELGSHQRDQR